MPQSHVGYGVAIVDPQIIEENNWHAGQILEHICQTAQLHTTFPEKTSYR